MEIITSQDMRLFNKNVIKFGDRVIIDLGNFKSIAVILEKDQVTQTRFGALKHNDCQGKSYGSKVLTSKGFVHVLAMNPVLWSETLHHRTQIIYPTDASFIVGQLELGPGKRVFESGTGSGSLTHFLIQSILPNGFVDTFDFHEDRVHCAANEFKAHLLDFCVRVNHRDVCTHYFPSVGNELNPTGVDAIILDLPKPWIIIPHVPKSFNPSSGGRVCIFSPCIEQIQRSCEALIDTGFIHLNTVECLEREYNMVRFNLDKPDLGLDRFCDPICLSNITNDNKIVTNNCGTKRKINPSFEEVLCNKNLSNKFNASKAEESIVEFDEKDKLITSKKCVDFVWQPILKLNANGHTGYMLFATWPVITKLSTFESNDCTV